MSAATDNYTYKSDSGPAAGTVCQCHDEQINFKVYTAFNVLIITVILWNMHAVM